VESVFDIYIRIFFHFLCLQKLYIVLPLGKACFPKFILMKKQKRISFMSYNATVDYISIVIIFS